jgi:hypothetical protein
VVSVVWKLWFSTFSATALICVCTMQPTTPPNNAHRVLCCAVLCCAVLCCAVLCLLCCAVLWWFVACSARCVVCGEARCATVIWRIVNTFLLAIVCFSPAPRATPNNSILLIRYHSACCAGSLGLWARLWERTSHPHCVRDRTRFSCASKSRIASFPLFILSSPVARHPRTPGPRSIAYGCVVTCEETPIRPTDYGSTHPLWLTPHFLVRPPLCCATHTPWFDPLFRLGVWVAHVAQALLKTPTHRFGAPLLRPPTRSSNPCVLAPPTCSASSAPRCRVEP